MDGWWTATVAEARVAVRSMLGKVAAMGFGHRNSGRGRRGGGKLPMRLIIILVIAGLGWAAKQGWLGPLGDMFGEQPSSGGGGPKMEKVSQAEVLSGARLVDARGNDGDSFLVRHGGKEHHFRLYFVDAPEKYISDFNEERVGYQAKYFGISKEDAVEAGLEAKEYARKLMAGNDLTIHTYWEQVYDSGRYYAFVELAPDDYLSERLVDSGLARIYTKGMTGPDGQSEKAFERDLESREKKAKGKRVGGWGK